MNYTPAASSRPSHLQDAAVPADESDEPWLSAIWQMLARIGRS